MGYLLRLHVLLKTRALPLVHLLEALSEVATIHKEVVHNNGYLPLIIHFIALVAIILIFVVVGYFVVQQVVDNGSYALSLHQVGGINGIHKNIWCYPSPPFFPSWLNHPPIW